jgi:hypothetical protein
MALDFLRRRQWVRGADEKPLRKMTIQRCAAINELGGFNHPS